MQRHHILRIFRFAAFLIVIVTSFFVMGNSFSTSFAFEAKISPDQKPVDILQNEFKHKDKNTKPSKELSKKEFILRVADNFYELSDGDRENACREFDGYFDDLIRNTDKNNWKDTGKELQDFISNSNGLKSWYITYLIREISSIKNAYQRKALMMGISRINNDKFIFISDSDVLKLYRLYNTDLINTLSLDEKILLLSGNYLRYNFPDYYKIDYLYTGKSRIEELEREKLRRKIVNVFFEITEKTGENEILVLIARNLTNRNLLQTPGDFNRYIDLLTRLKSNDSENNLLAQLLRTANFRKEKYLWESKTFTKLEEDRKKLKKKDDFFLCENRNDKFIRRHPESWFCRGAVEYQKVRGGEYYSYQQLKYMESEDQFHPEEEIPGWNRWLREFPDHPSADDALYRLGRCYEIKGDYDRAIGCFIDVLKAPDDYWRYEAVYRIVYILDVEMTGVDFENYLANNPDGMILPEILYSYGVNLMREGNYNRAISVFNDLMKKYPLKNDEFFIFSMYFYHKGSMEKNLIKQIIDCKALARLQKQIDNTKTSRQKADMLYKKGQYLYGNFLTFYNHLWNGGRVWYYYFSHGIRYDDEAPLTTTRIRRENLEKRFYDKFYNRMQAISVFKQIPKVDPNYPDMDKVYYSIAMEYTGFDGYQDNAEKYIDWRYGRAKYLEKLLKEFPDSPLADDAVFSYPDIYWNKKHNMSQKEYIVRKYPFSDMGRKLLMERNIPDASDTYLLRYHLRHAVSAQSVKKILLNYLKSRLGLSIRVRLISQDVDIMLSLAIWVINLPKYEILPKCPGSLIPVWAKQVM